jgi:hypothetical protein
LNVEDKLREIKFGVYQSVFMHGIFIGAAAMVFVRAAMPYETTFAALPQNKDRQNMYFDTKVHL